jgi:hypothetical protein
MPTNTKWEREKGNNEKWLKVNNLSVSIPFSETDSRGF